MNGVVYLAFSDLQRLVSDLRDQSIDAVEIHIDRQDPNRLEVRGIRTDVPGGIFYAGADSVDQLADLFE